MKEKCALWGCPWAALALQGQETKHENFSLPLCRLLANTGFPRGSDGKESACNAGDLDWIPRTGRPLEKGMATYCSILIHDLYCQQFGAKILSNCQCRKTQVENSKWCCIRSITWRQGRSSLEECTSNQPLKEFPPIYYPKWN